MIRPSFPSPSLPSAAQSVRPCTIESQEIVTVSDKRPIQVSRPDPSRPHLAFYVSLNMVPIDRPAPNRSKFKSRVPSCWAEASNSRDLTRTMLASRRGRMREEQDNHADQLQRRAL